MDITKEFLLTIFEKLEDIRCSSRNAYHLVSFDLPYSPAQRETEHIINALDECREMIREKILQNSQDDAKG